MKKRSLAALVIGFQLFAIGPGKASSQPLVVSIDEAITMALQRNQGLKTQRLQIQLAQNQLDEAESRFDDRVNAEMSGGSESAQRTLGNSAQFIDINSLTTLWSLGYNKPFPNGANVGIALSTSYAHRAWSNQTTDQQLTRVGISFTQALLQGRNPQVNQMAVSLAQQDLQISHHELQAFAATLVADTEQAFWDYSLASKQMALLDASVKLAQDQLQEIQARIRVGVLPEVELAAAQAELAQREQERLAAQLQVDSTRIRLLRLLNPHSGSWGDTELVLREPNWIPNVHLDPIPIHVALAVQQRPEIKQALQLVERRQLEVVQTQDGLLPKMDFFVNLGKTGYANSLLASVGSLIYNGHDLSAGIRFEYPLGNRANEAKHTRATLSQNQAQEALANLRQLVEMDIRLSYLQIQQSKSQIALTHTNAQLQQIKLNVEMGRFKTGQATSFMVAQAQRDVLNSQQQELQAIGTYFKTVSQFYRLEGSLLQRRKIDINL